MADRLDHALLSRRPDTISWSIAVGHLALVLVAVFGAAVIGPSPLLVVAWLWFGLTFTGPLNLMHECAHRLAFRRRTSSDWLGRWLLGPLALADFDAYRDRHWAHHRNLGLDGDTKDAYLVDIGGAGCLRLLLRCLTLQEAARKFGGQTRAVDPSTADDEVAIGAGLTGVGAGLRIAVVQALLLAAVLLVAATAHDGVDILVSAAVAYGFVYLYGLGALTVFAATLRAVAEHQVGSDDAPGRGRAALRNFPTGPFGRLVFGSYGFSNHATHHREPGVPHYRLGALTNRLVVSEPRLAPGRGYVATLWWLRRHPRPVAPLPAAPASARETPAR